jgi:hypothetical protein
MDEAIGWLKAKGKCEDSRGLGSCRLLVSLATQSSEGKPLSPGWTLDAYLHVIGLGSDPSAYRRYSVAIRRRRTFPLSPRDPAATLTTLKISTFKFEYDGKLLEQTTRLIVRTSNGDVLFDVAFPVPPYEGSLDSDEDFDILRNQLGVKWIWVNTR